jgi:hypothetical protein
MNNLFLSYSGSFIRGKLNNPKTYGWNNLVHPAATRAKTQCPPGLNPDVKVRINTKGVI